MITRYLAITGYVCVGLIVLALEVASRRPGSRIPRIADVTGDIMRYEAGGIPVGRLAILSFWFWLGWHFLAR